MDGWLGFNGILSTEAYICLVVNNTNQ